MAAKFALIVCLAIITSAACNQCKYDENEKSFECQIRTLQSGLDDQMLDVNKANKIRISCSDFSFAESRLKNGTLWKPAIFGGA